MEKFERWLALADEAVPDISTAEAMAGQVEVCPGEGPRYGAPNVELGLGCQFFFNSEVEPNKKISRLEKRT